MEHKEHYLQLKNYLREIHWHLDQRTDAPAFLTWSRRIREALIEIWGRDSNTVYDFDKLIVELKKKDLANHWQLNVIDQFLNDKLNELDQENEMTSSQKDSSTFDIVIVCALPDPELSAVRRIGQWTTLPNSADDPQTYHESIWKTKEGNEIRILAAAPNHMGLTATGVLAAKMIWRFRPKLIGIVGIAAGTNTKRQGFGDILVPSHTYDYGSGKTVVVNGAIQIAPNPNPLSIDSRLLARLNEWKATRHKLDDIPKNWPANLPATKLQMHIGPLFSSPTVLDANAPIAAEMQHWRKLIGVEMEAHAVHRAANDTIKPSPMFVCLKSICDFAEDKNDDWQPYAAYTSSQLFYHFVLEEWETITK